MIHIPLLRAGKPYKSLSTAQIIHFRTGEPVAEVSQANSGLIAKELNAAADNQRRMHDFTVAELLEICSRAADKFMTAHLPVGAETQSPEDYVHQLSSTTGMPEALCRRNMVKIETVLKNMPAVLDGLTRGLDLSILDSGSGVQSGRPLSYFSQANVMGAVLPSNSPGVHSLWLPAIPLKVPLALKPGREEPWTPFRIAQAFMAAGCPREAFGYFPSDHSGANEILLRSRRSMFFGDQSSVQAWKNDPRVQIHGPGWSKIIIAEDRVSDWEQYLDVIVTSIVENGGRSCLNASGVWVPAHGREIAEALATRLAQIEAKPMDHPEARLAAFTNKKFAHRINDMIESQLQASGAIDLTAKYRGTQRLFEIEGCTFLLPTIMWCENPQHSLANTEFLFPFASVVEVPQKNILHAIGASLVVTAITDDETFKNELYASPHVERLNLGAIPTNKISWDQPHEGNLFEHLYRQRAFQKMA